MLSVAAIKRLKISAQPYKNISFFRRDVKGAEQALALVLDVRRKTIILNED
jgi:hypothetical protein